MPRDRPGATGLAARRTHSPPRTAAIDRSFGPGLRKKLAEHDQQLLRGFPDLQVTIETT